MFDLFLLALLIPLWLPLSLMVALYVRLALGRPIVFRQPRAGFRGEVFMFLKFRSMLDRCDQLGNLLPDDQRLVPSGRWLRATSLDELPQLVHVVRGEMSLVGPRPLLVTYLPRYSERQSRRHDVLPGITGWAQVNGRNSLPWAERLELDAWYAEHQSLLLDCKILWKTLYKVFRRADVSQPGRATQEEFMGN